MPWKLGKIRRTMPSLLMDSPLGRVMVKGSLDASCERIFRYIMPLLQAMGRVQNSEKHWGQSTLRLRCHGSSKSEAWDDMDHPVDEVWYRSLKHVRVLT